MCDHVNVDVLCYTNSVRIVVCEDCNKILVEATSPENFSFGYSPRKGTFSVEIEPCETGEINLTEGN